MKISSYLFAAFSALLISFAATSARAQDDSAATGGDQGAPVQAPPPPDQGGQLESVPAPDQGGPPPNQGGNPGDQGGDQGASFQDFYDQLGSQGTWVQTNDYGYVFQPTVTDPNWAPYSDGHWVYTDDGWTWVTDEPWGWATYHYGRWCNIDGTGWCWVPGYRWAPAWVSWRYGGGYCGWAPLPPETFIGAEYGYGRGVRIGGGFHFGGDVDVSFNIGPGCYNFVPVGYMGARNYRGHYLDRSRNYVVINNTTNITNINIGGAGRERNFRGVSVGGPPLAQINAHSQERVQNVRLTEATQPGRGNLQGNSLGVYAPRMNAATMHQARPTHVGSTIEHTTLNRGDSISKPLAVTSSIRPNAPSTEAVQAAELARQHAPASAKVATEQTTLRTPLSQPLTSMQPVGEEHRTHTPATTGATGLNHTATVNPGAAHSATVTPHVVTPTHEDRSATASPYTGGPTHPASTYHPQTQGAPVQAYHPQTQTAPTYYPQTQQATPAIHPQTEQVTPTYHPQTPVAPTQSYHPQNEVEPSHTEHSQKQVAPTQTNHPQSESGGNHSSGAPAGAPHPQTQVAPGQSHESHESHSGGGGGAQHPQQAQGGGGGGNQGGGGGGGQKQH